MMISKAKLNINIISNKLSSKKDIYIMNIAVHYTLSIINYQLYIVHYEETLQSG